MIVEKRVLLASTPIIWTIPREIWECQAREVPGSCSLDALAG